MNFTKAFRYFSLVGAAVLLTGILFFVLQGLNIGIDFSGGSLLTLEMGKKVVITDVDKALDKLKFDHAPAQLSAGKDSQNGVTVRIKKQMKNEEVQPVLQTLKAKYPKVEKLGLDSVGGSSMELLQTKGMLALVVSFALILLYITIRFEFKSGVIGVLALIYDVLIMVVVVCIFKVPINSPFIAAVLTIIGYSINNTIIIFDRLRENVHIYKDTKATRKQLVNLSVNQTLNRTIYSTLTVLVTITVLYFLGVSSVKEFSLPIIVGLLSGVYTSVFLTAPLWAIWADYAEKKNKAKVAKA